LKNLGHYRLIVAEYTDESKKFEQPYNWHLVQSRDDKRLESLGSTGGASFRFGVDITIAKGYWSAPSTAEEAKFAFTYKGITSKTKEQIQALGS
jgi:hypothetical protein